MDSFEARARDFAERHHQAIGQQRKYTGEPYIVHPAAVAALVRTVPHTPAMLAAAWLHDTVEDTRATLTDIESVFGAEVADLVHMLTKPSRPIDGDRSARKALDLAHYSRASADAQSVKLADTVDNLRTVAVHDPAFAALYLAEKAALIDALVAGDPWLRQLAGRTLDAASSCLARQGISVATHAPPVPNSRPPTEQDAAGATVLPWDRPLCAIDVVFPGVGLVRAKPTRQDDSAREVLRRQFPEFASQAKIDGATALSAIVVGAYSVVVWNTRPLRAAIAVGLAAALALVVLRRELAWRCFLATMLVTARPAIRWLLPSQQPVVQRVELREWHLIIRYVESVIGVRWEDVIEMTLGFHRGDVVVRISIAGMQKDYADVCLAPASFAPTAKAMFRRNWRRDRAELLIDLSKLGVAPNEFLTQASARIEAAHRWYSEWW